jgi:hypothetical protein
MLRARVSIWHLTSIHVLDVVSFYFFAFVKYIKIPAYLAYSDIVGIVRSILRCISRGKFEYVDYAHYIKNVAYFFFLANKHNNNKHS